MKRNTNIAIGQYNALGSKKKSSFMEQIETRTRKQSFDDYRAGSPERK